MGTAQQAGAASSRADTQPLRLRDLELDTVPGLALDLLPDGVVVIGADRVVRQVNAAAERVLNQAGSEPGRARRPRVPPAAGHRRPRLVGADRPVGRPADPHRSPRAADAAARRGHPARGAGHRHVPASRSGAAGRPGGAGPARRRRAAADAGGARCAHLHGGPRCARR
nr:hypothetical protein [Angustibacter aerolatus]